MAEPYPFGKKVLQYKKLSDCQLVYALKDAREAWENQEEIERRIGHHWHAGKDAGWRADDYHTLLAVAQSRKAKYGKWPTCGE
jgi:hypothetical protein